ncbi:hypothetical protein ACTTBA_04205 [Shewanella frigidimarina]|uniref:hypothetical protein n=1 Tax=Shewanella frigidimarina TaxID=56812 RepID=UPI003F9EDFDD
MNLETLLSTNIIVPIAVAFVGFLIAVTTAVIAKEHKVSEFRQAWIDALREDLSKFYAVNYELIPIYTKGMLSAAEITKTFNENNLIFDELSARIILRLNWDEHKEIINVIDSIYDFRINFKFDSPDFKPLNMHLSNFLTQSKNILSTEWKVVKKGESLFLKFKYVSKILASTFLIAMYVLFTIALLQSSIFQW